MSYVFLHVFLYVSVFPYIVYHYTLGPHHNNSLAH